MYFKATKEIMDTQKMTIVIKGTATKWFESNKGKQLQLAKLNLNFVCNNIATSHHYNTLFSETYYIDVL